MENVPFPFRTTREAWLHFTKAALINFVQLIKQEEKHIENLREKIKALEYRDYCARLIYLMDMFSQDDGTIDTEFDLDWAMLVAKPLSAKQARQSLRDLIQLGLIHETEQKDKQTDGKLYLEAGTNEEYSGVDEKNQADGEGRVDPNIIPPRNRDVQGRNSSDTKFDFD